MRACVCACVCVYVSVRVCGPGGGSLPEDNTKKRS